MNQPALVLGIESSCDETAAAVVQDGNKILSNVVHSQVALHERFRGVVPEIASRSHVQRILPLVEDALQQAGVQPKQLDAIAVTNQPGMIGCLLVGMAAAKTMCWMYEKPLVGVNHIQAHIHAAFMTDPDLPLPCLAMVASGGHTAMYTVPAPGQSQRIGQTRDDAAGEALDKGAAMLGLPYPGGPAIQEAAKQGNSKAFAFPRPMAQQGLDFSFSGIKTALLYQLRGSGLTRPMPELDAQQVADLAASYQAAIVDCLLTKLRRAAKQSAARSLSIGGGVACNEELRQRLRDDPVLSKLQLVFPAMALCSDNAAMVAGLGTHLWLQGQQDPLDLAPAATSRGRT